MADNDKKSGKSSGWVAVGDSMDGIKNLRPDVIREKIQQVDAQLKKSGVPSASSTTTRSVPVGSSTKETTPKGK